MSRVLHLLAISCADGSAGVTGALVALLALYSFYQCLLQNQKAPWVYSLLFVYRLNLIIIQNICRLIFIAKKSAT